MNSRRLGPKVALACTDIIGIGAAMAIGYSLRFVLQLGAIAPVATPALRDYIEPVLLIALVWIWILADYGLYELDLLARRFSVFERVVKAVSLGTLVVLAATFYYRGFSYSRAVAVFAWGLSILFLSGTRLLLLSRRRRRFAQGIGLRPTVVIAHPRRSAIVLRRLLDPQFGLHIIGLIEPRNGVVDVPLKNPTDEEQDPKKPHPERSLEVLGTTDELKKVLTERTIAEVIVTEPFLEHEELLQIIECCEQSDVETRIVPPIHDLLITASDIHDMHGLPFVRVREHYRRYMGRLVKRLFDLGVALTVQLICAPLMLLIAIALRWSCGSPVLFTQERSGENGAPFPMYKFRTMSNDAEQRLAELVDLEDLAEPVFKLQHDPRVTPLGGFLRRWSLDELPQLWNVILGTMSLVGPRPEEVSLAERYDTRQRRRLKAKPGITGLQQVENRGVESLAARVELDLYYLRHQSFLFDLWILLRTPAAVLGRRGAR